MEAFSSTYSGRSQHIALLVFNFSRHEEPGAQLHNFKLRNHCTSMGPIYLYCHNPDQTSGLQCQLYKILKHRHRQKFTSHQFFSLLWLSSIERQIQIHQLHGRPSRPWDKFKTRHIINTGLLFTHLKTQEILVFISLTLCPKTYFEISFKFWQ